MKIKLPCLIFVFTLFIHHAFSQCGTILTVNNPSFEGTPQAHVTPPGWDICMPGLTPDTQPGSWTITLAPSNGGSYIGLVHDPSISWQEGAGQTLSAPMVAGMQYRFTIDLATSDVVGYGITPGPVELQLWGGWAGGNGCSQVELLWHSGNVTSLTWVTYNLVFTPSQNFDHILFLVNSMSSGYSPYIMMDNMTPIIPLPDLPNFSTSSNLPNGNYCDGASITFHDLTTSPGGYSITGWNWNFGDGSPNSGQQNPSHVFPGPGIYNITLTTTNSINCTFSNSRNIEIFGYPDANFTFNNICEGSMLNINNTTTITGTPIAQDNLTWYYWVTNDGHYYYNTSFNPSFIPNRTGPIDIMLYIARHGCADSLHQTVTIYPNPVVLLPPDTIYCTGGQVTVDAGNPGSTYLWSDNSTGRYNTFSTAGIYTVTVTSSNNCSGSDDIQIFNHVNPTPSITGLTPVCAYALEHYTTPGNTTGVYNWTVTGGNIISGAGTNDIGIQWGSGPTGYIGLIESYPATGCQGSTSLNVSIYPPLPTITFPAVPDFCTADPTFILNTATPQGGVYLINGNQYTVIDPDLMGAGSYHIVYRFSDSHGCSDSVSHDFNIFDSPNLNVTPPGSAFCYGESVNLNATGAEQYAWSPSAGLSDAGSPTPVANPTVSTTYTLIGWTSHGCYDTITVPITVYPLPVVNLPTIHDMCTYHPDVPLDFATPPGGTYLLNGSPATVISPSHLPEGPYTLVYNYTDANSCFSSASQSFNIYQQPYLTLQPGDTNLCAGDGITLSASGADNYHWYPAAGLTDSLSPIVYASPMQTTIYTLVGTNNNGCSDTSTIKIGMYRVPNPNLGSDIVLCNISSYTINIDPENMNYDIVWKDGTGGTSYTVTEPDTLWVAISNNGCIRYDTIIIYPCLDIWMPNAFSPNGDGYNETFEGKPTDSDILADFHLFIYNRWGALLFESEDIKKRWDGTYNSGKCPEGVYYWIMKYSVKGVNGKDIKFTKSGSVTLVR